MSARHSASQASKSIYSLSQAISVQVGISISAFLTFSLTFSLLLIYRFCLLLLLIDVQIILELGFIRSGYSLIILALFPRW
jgi:hypothetical protein